ncbi:MAG TPA: nucleotidyltransferase family protein, partial [Polyangia bacterium]
MIFGAQPARGARIAELHVGLWRASPPPLGIDAPALDALAPLFLSSGSAPLLWRRIANTPLAHAASAPALKEAWRYQQLQSELRSRELAQAVAQLAHAGITPLLSRGWAAARLYPEPELRSYVDH